LVRPHTDLLDVDGLLYFGNVAAAYSSLRSKTFEDLSAFFTQKRFDTAAIAQRGPALPLEDIAKDDRYLISEMVCKTFGDLPEDKEQARAMLLTGLKQHKGATITFRQLLDGVSQTSTREQLLLSFDDVLNASLSSEDDVNRRFDEQFENFLPLGEWQRAILTFIFLWSMILMYTSQRACEAGRTSATWLAPATASSTMRDCRNFTYGTSTLR
jgi:hypothetical protein